MGRKANKYGNPYIYESDFHGPVYYRSCTDVIPCIAFMVFIVGMFIVGCYAFKNGDPRKLVYPTDYKGQMCGITPGVEDKPYLFFFDLLKCSSSLISFQLNCPTTQICVSAFPTESYTVYTDVFRSSASDFVNGSIPDFSRLESFCDYGFDPLRENQDPTSRYYGTDGLKKMLEEERCPTYYLKSTSFLGRCIPKFLVDVVEGVVSAVTAKDSFTTEITNSLNGQDLTLANGQIYSLENLASLLSDAVSIFLHFQKTAALILDDFYAVWYSIAIGLCAAMLLSFLYIVLMRCIAGPMVCFSIIGLYAVIVWGIYCWVRYIHTHIEQSLTDIGFTDESYRYLKETHLSVVIFLSVMLAVVLLITVSQCKEIRLAVGLIQEASKAVSSMISTLFFPIVPFVLQVIVINVCGFIALFLASSGEQDCLWMAPSIESFTYHNQSLPREDFECECGLDENDVRVMDVFKKPTHENLTMSYGHVTIVCEFQSYAVPYIVHYFQIYNLFGLFWLMLIIVGLCQMTLAGAFASWHWTFDKEPTHAVAVSFRRTVRFHLGSIAIGSLNYGISVIFSIFDYMERKLKDQENQVVKFIVNCLKWCFLCLEFFIKYTNKDAYIMIAVHGRDYYTAAKKAFSLLMRNILRVFVVSRMADFIMFLGIMFVAFLCSVGSFYYFTNSIPVVSDYVPAPELNYYWFPIITIGVCSFAISKGFFSVYAMAVDTLFLCYLEDFERNDGSARRPYYMPQNLRKKFSKWNKKVKKAKVEDEDD